MTIDEKVKIQQKFGTIHVKTFQKCNPFASPKDSDAGDSLNYAIRWCNDDFNTWVMGMPPIIVLSRHYSEHGVSCLLSVSYVMNNKEF